MTREEIIDFCDMKSQLEPENEDIFNYIIKALEQKLPEKQNGKWINLNRGFWMCSVCGEFMYSESEHDRKEHQRFCSRCGADMRGGQK